MELDNLTIGEAKKLAALFNSADEGSFTPHTGKKCIIRTYASGVHFGVLVAQSGRQVELRKSRRLWRWDAAPNGISLSEVALHGPVGSRSKICSEISEITILDALEIIPCTDAAISVIEGSKVYTP